MIKRYRGVCWGLFFSVLLASGCTQAEDQALQVEDAYVRGLPPTQRNTAAFFTLVNHSDRDIEVLAAPAPSVAERVEIHAHLHRDGMMSMQQQHSVTVAAGERKAFAPGALHLMLIELQRPLREGDEVELALQTAAGDTIAFSAPVISVLNEGKGQTDKGSMDHAHH